MSIKLIVIANKGSSKSGNFGHSGRPGKLGGSMPKRSQTGVYAGRMRTGQTGNIAVKTPSERRGVIAAGKVGVVDAGVRQKVRVFGGGDPSGKGWIVHGNSDTGNYTRIEGGRAAHIRSGANNAYDLMIDDGSKSHTLPSLAKQVAFDYGDGFVKGQFGVGDIRSAAGVL